MIPALVKRAQNGDVEAQLTLGMNYERGMIVKTDLEAALSWYKTAATAGSTFAMHRLADGCRQGIFPGGVEASENWRKKADAKGEAQLAVVLKGIEVPGHIPDYRNPKKKRSKAVEIEIRKKNTGGKKVLVIDDDESIHAMLKVILDSLEHQVLLASNLKDGLKKMGENPDIQLILLDYHMPNGNSLQMISLMRKMKILEGVPIVMVSSRSDKEVIKEAVTLGVKGWIVKPFNKERVEAVLKPLVA
jgi:two-component system chemotaxis response regulator CheY